MDLSLDALARWGRRLVPRSLFGRALVILAAPILLTQAVATFIFYDRHWDSVSRRLALAVASEIRLVINELEALPDDAARQVWLAQVRKSIGMHVTIDPEGKLRTKNRYGSSFLILDRMLSQSLNEQLPQPFAIDTNRPGDLVLVEVQLPGGLLKAMFSIKRVSSPTSYIFILWMVGSSLVFLGIAIVFLRNQIRPILRLAEAAEKFGRGIEVEDFRASGATEVRTAGKAFLEMRDRIKSFIQQRTEMLAGVSHDLRTPITRMKLQLAMMPGDEDVENLKADVAEMAHMVEGYLAFARDQAEESARPVPLRALLEDVVGKALRQGGQVTLHVEDDPIVTVQAESIKRCLTNLLDNACRYGVEAEVRGERIDGWIQVAIDDDGPGIPPDKREEVFKPFYRLDPSRNPETGGSGLGLTLARDAARRHGGDVTLSASAKGGVRAILRLPV